MRSRLEPGVDYGINLQYGKSAYEKGDVADEPLFTFVDPSIFERRTFKLFYDLLDNYERGVRAFFRPLWLCDAKQSRASGRPVSRRLSRPKSSRRTTSSSTPSSRLRPCATPTSTSAALPWLPRPSDAHTLSLVAAGWSRTRSSRATSAPSRRSSTSSGASGCSDGAAASLSRLTLSFQLSRFGLYRRQASNDSSGFEHVFVGEERDVRSYLSLALRL